MYSCEEREGRCTAQQQGIIPTILTQWSEARQPQTSPPAWGAWTHSPFLTQQQGALHAPPSWLHGF